MSLSESSPSWYLADIVEVITVEDDARNVVHINTVLISATSSNEAFDKALKIGRTANSRYQNPEGKAVQIEFRGLKELSLVEEPLEDGAEIAWTELVSVPEAEIAESVRPKEELSVFASRRVGLGKPNYLSSEIALELQARGFTREEIESFRAGPTPPEEPRK